MFKRLSISYKIGLIAVIGFIGFAIYQGVNYQLSLEIRNRLGNLITEEFPVLRFSNYVQVNFNELDKLYQAALAESDIDTLLEADAKADDIEIEFSQIESNYDIYNTSFYELSALFKKYRQSISLHTRQVIEKRLTYDQVIEGYSQIALIREQLLAIQTQFLENRYQSFSVSLDSMEKDEEFIVQFGLILGIILLVLLGCVSALIIHRINSAFQLGVDFAHSIAAGNLNATIDTEAQDETGQLIKSLNAMRHVLKRQARDNQIREHEQLFLAGLNDAMRGDPRLQDLAEKVSRYLLTSIPLIDSTSFYLKVDEENLVVLNVQGQGDENQQNMLFENSLSILEGRAGEAINAKSLIEFRGAELLHDQGVTFLEANQDHFPNYWVYFPVILEKEVKALLLMGCHESMDADTRRLLDLASNALAIAINSAQARKKVANMLEQTQIQAKELTTQQRKLALINDQLEDKTIDLDKQRHKILEKNALLEISQEKLLEKSAALEASGRYKSQFLSTMSHELRTPLNSILLLSEALLENREQNLSDKQVRHADVIHHAGEELLSLINDILDLSKVEEGKMDVVIEAISPEAFLTRLRTQSEVLATDKQLSFDIQLSDNLPEFIYSDEQRLYQILKNFVSNALKFTEDGGITVMVTLLGQDELPSDFMAREPQSYVCFTVIDTGVGIDPEKQEVVFEAFKQADGTTSRKFGGTGLGLTISRELAHLLDGEVALYSKGLGQGTSFMVYLPVGDRESISAEVSDIVEPEKPLAFECELLHSMPLPERLPCDTVCFLSTSSDWHVLIKKKAELSSLKLSIIEDAEAFTHFTARNLPRAFVVDSDSTALVSVLVAANLNVPVFTVGESLSTSLSTEYEVLRWFDQHSLNQIIERLVLGADAVLARVLFVEDNPVFHEVVRSVFAKYSLSVDLVDDAKSAVDALYHKTYELVVVDLNLPDFSGEQVMKIARSLPILSDRNIVLFTAEDLQAEYKKHLLSIADEVVFKSPQAINELAIKAEAFVKQNKNRVYRSQLFESQALATLAYQPGILQGARVLLVDDDERNLYSLGSALEAEGIIVYQAQSGAEVFEILSSDENLDLILLDIMMPDMDGYEVLNRIRHNPSWSFLPVIALTAKAMVGDKQRCLDAGASDYLSKPVSMKNLLDKMMVYIS